jgi:hypothetical protein
LILQQKFFILLKDSKHFEDELAVFVDVVEAWMKRLDEISIEDETFIDEDIKRSSSKVYGSWKH